MDLNGHKPAELTVVLVVASLQRAPHAWDKNVETLITFGDPSPKCLREPRNFIVSILCFFFPGPGPAIKKC